MHRLYHKPFRIKHLESFYQGVDIIYYKMLRRVTISGLPHLLVKSNMLHM